MGFSFIFGRLEMSLLEAVYLGGLEDGWRQRHRGVAVRDGTLTAAMMAEGWDEVAEGSTAATRLCCS